MILLPHRPDLDYRKRPLNRRRWCIRTVFWSSGGGGGGGLPRSIDAKEGNVGNDLRRRRPDRWRKCIEPRLFEADRTSTVSIASPIVMRYCENRFSIMFLLLKNEIQVRMVDSRNDIIARYTVECCHVMSISCYAHSDVIIRVLR